VPSNSVSKNDFINFVRFYYRDLNEVQTTDIYMNVTKKLQALLQTPVGPRGGEESPMRKRNTDIKGIVQSSSSSPNLRLGPYGMS